MSEPTEAELQAFIEDVEFLIKTLKESFESTDAEFFYRRTKRNSVCKAGRLK
jgi:hypothetical protein